MMMPMVMAMMEMMVVVGMMVDVMVMVMVMTRVNHVREDRNAYLLLSGRCCRAFFWPKNGRWGG